MHLDMLRLNHSVKQMENQILTAQIDCRVFRFIRSGHFIFFFSLSCDFIIVDGIRLNFSESNEKNHRKMLCS